MAERYATLWSQHDPAGTRFLSFEALLELIQQLEHPLGLASSPTLSEATRRHPKLMRHEAARLVHRLVLVPDALNRFHFHAVLHALVDRASGGRALGFPLDAVMLAQGGRVVTEGFTLAELRAAMALQGAWRVHKAKQAAEELRRERVAAAAGTTVSAAQRRSLALSSVGSGSAVAGAGVGGILAARSSGGDSWGHGGGGGGGSGRGSAPRGGRRPSLVEGIAALGAGLLARVMRRGSIGAAPAAATVNPAPGVPLTEGAGAAATATSADGAAVGDSARRPRSQQAPSSPPPPPQRAGVRSAGARFEGGAVGRAEEAADLADSFRRPPLPPRAVAQPARLSLSAAAADSPVMAPEQPNAAAAAAPATARSVSGRASGSAPGVQALLVAARVQAGAAAAMTPTPPTAPRATSYAGPVYTADVPSSSLPQLRVVAPGPNIAGVAGWQATSVPARRQRDAAPPRQTAERQVELVDVPTLAAAAAPMRSAPPPAAAMPPVVAGQPVRAHVPESEATTEPPAEAAATAVAGQGQGALDAAPVAGVEPAAGQAPGSPGGRGAAQPEGRVHVAAATRLAASGASGRGLTPSLDGTGGTG
jgi:hypothetical protein